MALREGLVRDGSCWWRDPSRACCCPLHPAGKTSRHSLWCIEREKHIIIVSSFLYTMGEEIVKIMVSAVVLHITRLRNNLSTVQELKEK